MAQNKIIQPYIKHDENASQDGKILKMCLDFRKIAKTMSREDLEQLASHGAYALFWRLIEHLYSNHLQASDVEVMADNLRVNADFLNKILNEYDLFKLQNDEYVSIRLLRDRELRDEKSQKASESVNIRYLLSSFNKAYTEFFGEEPILESSEIETLKKYSKKIPDLKDKLRDILYTLKCLKFDNDINFKPCANWLLTGNNFGRLVNGEFGKLKHKKTKKELSEEAKQAESVEKHSEFDEIETISGKAAALEYIANYYAGRKIAYQNGRALLIPPLSKLAKKFDITDEEILQKCQE